MAHFCSHHATGRQAAVIVQTCSCKKRDGVEMYRGVRLGRSTTLSSSHRGVTVVKVLGRTCLSPQTSILFRCNSERVKFPMCPSTWCVQPNPCDREKRVSQHRRILCPRLENNDIDEEPKTRMHICNQVVIPKHDIVPL